MECRKDSARFGFEIQEKTGNDAEQPEGQHYHGNRFVQEHVGVEQIAVYHDVSGPDAAQHGDEPNGTYDAMALSEKFLRLAEMQAPGSLKSKVGCINPKQDSTKLGNGMDAEDERHKFRPLEFFTFPVNTASV
jgi:hypothetical protein